MAMQIAVVSLAMMVMFTLAGRAATYGAEQLRGAAERAMLVEGPEADVLRQLDPGYDDRRAQSVLGSQG
jgi:hypothetical protein